MRTLFAKAVSLVLALSGGLSIGKEGPYVHMASCVADQLCRLRPFRRLYQKTPARDGPADSGMLDLLNDDVLRLLYRHLARIPTGARAGTALQSAVRLTGRSVLGLRLSCTRLNAIFCDANAVRREMHARAATQIVPASLHPDEVEAATGFEMPEGEFETLAGLVLDRLGQIPEPGEMVELEGWRLEVVAMDRLRIATVRIVAPAEEADS